MKTEAEILEGLAEELWRSSDRDADEFWLDDWVRDKWRRYARVAIGYLAQQTVKPDPPRPTTGIIARDVF